MAGARPSRRVEPSGMVMCRQPCGIRERACSMARWEKVGRWSSTAGVAGGGGWVGGAAGVGFMRVGGLTLLGGFGRG